MDQKNIIQIIILLLLLAGSSFFSSAETALMSLSKIRIRHMLEEGVKGAKLVHKLISTPNKLLGTILVGNNIVNIGASALATSLAITYFGASGVTVATIFMTVLVLIFGEITPKTLAAQNAEKVAIKVSKPIYFLMNILGPVIKFINFITTGLIRLLGGNVEGNQALITEDELKTMINVSHEEGVLDVDERQMIQNVFDFTDATVSEVMVPRTAVSFLSSQSSKEEVYEIFKQEQYSRMPIFHETRDNVVGILHVKDLIFLDQDAQFNLSQLMKKPFFTYEFKKIAELFEEMRKGRHGLAVVLDEYGGTVGIVSMEDLVEEIVGDIHDEYDIATESIRVIKENEYVIDGATRLEDVEEEIGVSFVAEGVETTGGYVIHQLGRLPASGETIELDGMRIVVLNVVKNRIASIRLFLLDK